MYYLICELQAQGLPENYTLMLIDRNHRQDCWWTKYITEAIGFHKYSAAENQLAKLKYSYNSPRIVDELTAHKLSKQNEMIDDVYRPLMNLETEIDRGVNF